MIKKMSVLKNNDGVATYLAGLIMFFLLLLIFVSLMEFYRIERQLFEIREGVDKAVANLVADNYDDSFKSGREGYLSAYKKRGNRWEDIVDEGNVLEELEDVLALQTISGELVRNPGNEDYRIQGIRISLENATFRGGENLKVNSKISVAIPLIKGIGNFGQLKLDLKVESHFKSRFGGG